MHRLLVETALLSEDAPILPADAARHLRVVRPREGEEVELFDGKGRSRVFKVRGPRLDGAGCLSPVSETLSFERSTLDLTLFACVTKGSRWDWTIEKATELGATRIVPVISDRTIVRIPGAERAAKRERWLRIAEDAARQSDAKWLPEITEATDFRETLPLVRETACFIGALTDPPSPPISVAYGRVITAGREEGRTVVPLSTYIGPEGDFTPEELAALMEVATPVSFGPTVLRAETAAIFALSALRTLSLGRGF